METCFFVYTISWMYLAGEYDLTYLKEEILWTFPLGSHKEGSCMVSFIRIGMCIVIEELQFYSEIRFQ